MSKKYIALFKAIKRNGLRSIYELPYVLFILFVNWLGGKIENLGEKISHIGNRMSWWKYFDFE